MGVPSRQMDTIMREGAHTFMTLSAITDQTEGLWIMLAERGKKSAAALNVWTQAGLTGLS